MSDREATIAGFMGLLAFGLIVGGVYIALGSGSALVAAGVLILAAAFRAAR